MKLDYIQFKANISSVLWMIANGMGLSYFPTKFVYKGHSFGNTWWLGRKGKGYFLCGDKTTRLKEIIEEMKQELNDDPHHIVRVKEMFDERVTKREMYMAFLESGNFHSLSNEQLLEYYNGILNTYYEVYPYGEPIAFVSKDFAEQLKKEFNGTEEEFYILISPREKSFLQREEMELLEIAIFAKKEGITEKVREMIKGHTSGFCWVPYDYGANIYSEGHFMRELEKLLEKDLRMLEKEFDDLKNYENNIISRQKNIYSKYSIDNHQQDLFAIVQICYYLVDAKKEFFTKLHWFSERIFTEISKRLNLDKELVRHALPEEIKNYLLNEKEPEEHKLKERIMDYFFVVKPDGSYDLKQGDEAKKIIDKFLETYEKKDDVDIIKGRTAQAGKATGRAKIIMDALHCHRIKHGDVLVVPMTSPDYMVAVKRSSAIVTDEGGITCHAAIISRELKKPCVIGTKNATKILRDGDEVEVDADKGIVRMIK